MVQEGVTRYTTAGGARIYRIPLQVFPSLRAYVYLIIAGDYVALVDTGSGQGASDTDLQKGMACIRDEWGETVTWSDLDRIVLTHAHIDHHGGLQTVRRLTNAPLAVHELDRRVIVHHEERLTLTRFRLGIFLQRAGIDEERRSRMLHMYASGKHLVRSMPVDDVLHDGDLLDGILRVIHVPGHCPGHVCLHIEDVLITGDHVLPHFALFLSPESLTASNGVDHFLNSLKKVASLSNVRLCLGGHDQPVFDLGAAVEKIEATQRQHIQRVYEACAQPSTIAELTARLYPFARGYDELLAVQKVGAYVEYLDQRGMLAIANLAEVAANDAAAPRYLAV